MATTNLKVSERKIAQFCRKHGIRKLSFFGSSLREVFRPDSDVDRRKAILESARDVYAA